MVDGDSAQRQLAQSKKSRKVNAVEAEAILLVIGLGLDAGVGHASLFNRLSVGRMKAGRVLDAPHFFPSRSIALLSNNFQVFVLAQGKQISDSSFQ